MRILGVSAFGRDSAAALVVDGKPVAAAQEERFTRISLDPGFPSRAIRYCLATQDLRGGDLDAVVFHEKPLRKFERVLALNLRAFPRSSISFARNLFLWLGERLWIRHRIAEELGVAASRVLFVDHQRAIAANSFFTSGFEEAAVLTVDDVGEWATATLGHAAGKLVRLEREVWHPHSLGLFASAITQFMGFVPGQDEDKVEALAARGSPALVDELGALVHDAMGLFVVEQKPFRFGYDGKALFGPELEELLGPPRRPQDVLRIEAPETRDADLAASLQAVLERTVLSLCETLRKATSAKNLCFGGAVASNRRLNARLAAEAPFEALHVAPAPGKAGAALGAALFCHHSLSGDGAVDVSAVRDVSFLGEGLEDDRAEPGARQLADDGAARDEILRRLLEDRCVGWVHGRMEFGPRSLGHRCILTSARKGDARERLFGALQVTDAFLPCRVAITTEAAEEFFELRAGCDAALAAGHLMASGREALRRHAPSALLPDGQAWPQLVSADTNAALHDLLSRYGDAAGAPLLLLDDLRLRGAPLVRSEAEAVEAFRRSALDCLVCDSRIYE